MFIIRLNKNNKLLSVFKSLFRNKLTNDIRNNDIAPDIASKTVATLKAGSKLLVSSAILTKKKLKHLYYRNRRSHETRYLFFIIQIIRIHIEK